MLSAINISLASNLFSSSFKKLLMMVSLEKLSFNGRGLTLKLHLFALIQGKLQTNWLSPFKVCFAFSFYRNVVNEIKLDN